MTRAPVTFLAFSLSAALVANAEGEAGGESFWGNGQAGFTNSDGQVGQFNRPHGLAVDGKGNIYVSDRGNHAIRVVTAFGDIRTLAGNGKEGNADGVVAAAIADRNNHRIRAASPAGEITTVAGDGTAGHQDGPAQTAKFNRPIDVVLASDG